MDDQISAPAGSGRIEAAHRGHGWLPLLRLVVEALVGRYERDPDPASTAPDASPAAPRKRRMRREPLIERS